METNEDSREALAADQELSNDELDAVTGGKNLSPYGAAMTHGVTVTRSEVMPRIASRGADAAE